MNPKTIKIDEIEYVRKDSLEEEAEQLDGMDYCIVRGDRSGVFAGYIRERKDNEVTIINCRRLWYWDGAASLSQLAVDGVSKPQNCKFPKEVGEMLVLDAIEIIPCTAKAQKSIGLVGVWSQ
jgi:hypothetical protein